MMWLGGSIQVVAERILNCIPVGLLTAASTWLLLRVTACENSRTRFAMWFVSLLAIAAFPFVPAAHIVGSLRHQDAEVTLPASWAVGFMSLWGVVALFAVARLGVGVARLRVLRRNSRPIPTEGLEERLRATIDECQSIRPFEVRVSSDVRVPTAIGLFTPTILLPDWSLKELSPEELSIVVLHEFAHLRRRDDWTNLVQKLVRAVFFFHPAVLWVEKRLSLEREMACDEVVLAATGKPQAYAHILVSVAEKSLLRRSMALGQAVIGRARETSLRLAHILSGDRRRASRMFKPALAAAGAMVVLSFVVLPKPHLVAFQDSITTAGQAAALQPPIIPDSMIVPAVARLGSGPRTLAANSKKETIGAVSHRRSKESAPGVHSGARPLLAMSRSKYAHFSSGPRALQAGLHGATRQMLIVERTTDYYEHGEGIIGVTEWRVMLVNVPVEKTFQAKQPNRT